MPNHLVEGEEQMDRPNSQTAILIWYFAMHVIHRFFGFNINTTVLCLG